MKKLLKMVDVARNATKNSKESRFEMKVKATETAVTRHPIRQLRAKVTTESKYDHLKNPNIITAYNPPNTIEECSILVR